MSVSFYYLSIYLGIIIEFLFFMIIGVPVLLLILWLLDKYCSRVALSKRKRRKIAFISNLAFSITVGIYLYLEPYRYDRAFDIATERSNIALPFYFITSIDYPANSNEGDDFCVVKTLKFWNSPSKKEIEQLDQLCINDERWTKENNEYHYHEGIEGTELVLDVIIYVDYNKVVTRYLRW